jgi:hypothetical protein
MVLIKLISLTDYNTKRNIHTCTKSLFKRDQDLLIDKSRKAACDHVIEFDNPLHVHNGFLNWLVLPVGELQLFYIYYSSTYKFIISIIYSTHVEIFRKKICFLLQTVLYSHFMKMGFMPH